MSEQLNDIIHQPTRTRILVYLAAHDSLDFNTLKSELKLSDGQIATQMRLLEGAGYVSVEKTFVNRKPRTSYSLTQEGREKFNLYLESLAEILRSCS